MREAVTTSVSPTEDLARAFGDLARLKREVAAGLPDLPVDLAHDPEAFASGEPLLADVDPDWLVAAFRLAGGRLLPGLADIFPPLAPAAERLGAALAGRPGLAEELLDMAQSGDAGKLVELSRTLGLVPAGLSFLTREILSATLRRAASGLSALADDALWNKGYCPVCGGGPDCGMLKDKPEPSEYLISKAGRLLFHCSLCGHGWRFARLTCPACGELDHQKLDVFMADGRERERIHSCRSCGAYVLVVDRVELADPLDMDLVPASLAHLDAVAAKKGLHPLVETPWSVAFSGKAAASAG